MKKLAILIAASALTFNVHAAEKKDYICTDEAGYERELSTDLTPEVFMVPLSKVLKINLVDCREKDND